MPKGDKYKLKADIEDGFTQIANTLLVAVAMAHLSGLEVRALIYLWRQTYGWKGINNKKKKEAKITLDEWATSLNTTIQSASRILSSLEKKNVIRKKYFHGKTSVYYRTNTEISAWVCVDKQRLAEKLNVLSQDVEHGIDQIDEECLPDLATAADMDLSSDKYKENIDTINKEIKEEAAAYAAASTAEELKCLEYMSSNLCGWHIDQEEDIHWLRKIFQKYKATSNDIFCCCDCFSEDKEPKSKFIWKANIDKWMRGYLYFNEK